MKALMWAYANPESNITWIAASLQAAHAVQRGLHYAKQLKKWSRAYITDQTCLPYNIYGTWNESLLEHEDLAQELHLHLQGIGKHICTQDIIDYLDQTDVKAQLKLKKTISLATAQRWMTKMGYRWTKVPSGQFVDGHERLDVVSYCQDVFLPAWAKLEPMM
jgi:hypothetical protein